jgi:hypothetical protein
VKKGTQPGFPSPLPAPPPTFIDFHAAAAKERKKNQGMRNRKRIGQNRKCTGYEEEVKTDPVNRSNKGQK